MKTLMVAILVAGTAALTAPAFGQQVEIETKVRQHPTILAPGLLNEHSRPTDGEWYLPGPMVDHDPAFIEPFTVETSTGRFGLSGWTAPTTPVGVQGEEQNPGYLAFGLTFTWGGPPRKLPAAKRPVR
jgi:hypothetical protein